VLQRVEQITGFKLLGIPVSDIDSHIWGDYIATVTAKSSNCLRFLKRRTELVYHSCIFCAAVMPSLELLQIYCAVWHYRLMSELESWMGMGTAVIPHIQTSWNFAYLLPVAVGQSVWQFRFWGWCHVFTWWGTNGDTVIGWTNEWSGGLQTKTWTKENLERGCAKTLSGT